MKILIIIPIYNKYNKIFKIVDDLKKHASNYDYLLINDGSDDRTKQILQNNNLPHLTHPIHCGFSASIQTGFLYAYQNNYDYLISIDESNQLNFKYIKKMINLIENSKLDLVQASRYCKTNKTNKNRISKISSKLMSSFIFITTFKKVTDPINSMRLFGKRLIKEFATNSNYLSDADTLSYLLRNRYAMKEVYVPSLKIKNKDTKFFKSFVNFFVISFSIFFIQPFRKRTKKNSLKSNNKNKEFIN